MSWFLFVNDFARATPWLHLPARLFAQYGIIGFAAVLLLSWWLARRVPGTRAMSAAMWAPLGALVAIGLNQPLGKLVAEPRPFTAFPHALVLVSRSTDYSFPSDHAVMAGAVFAGVLLAHGGRHRLTIWTGVAAVAMAFTRVYVGAHFPRDVIAGLVLGAAVSGLGYLVVRPALRRITAWVRSSPLKPLVSATPVSPTDLGAT